jgi:DNA-binding NtrC family response regulator
VPPTLHSTAVYSTSDTADAPVRPLYLLVLGKTAARVVPLPEEGNYIVGRATDVAVQLEEAAVSRHHAVISVHDNRATIRDLDSHNGTFVDGQRVAGEVALHSGAVIEVCKTQLVVHGGAAARAPVRDLESMRARLADEIERANLRDHGVAVAVFRLDGRDAGLADRMTAELRPIDRSVRLGPTELMVLLPEVDGDEAAELAARLLAGAGQGARAGYAQLGRDAGDADALIAAARAAAVSAPVGVAASAEATRPAIEIRERKVIVADESMVRLYALLERIAAVDLPVLVQGETGTGKELAAAAVHHFSPRRAGPLVAFNCAAVQDTLAESELFGHERGAFTGAHSDKAGVLESAAGGTLFLDEVAELSLGVQAKLLRVLENRSFNRVGSAAESTVDVRIVAATNRDLLAEVEADRFRRDLYYRLSAATLWLPPLRDRLREIPILAATFLAGATVAGTAQPVLSDEALRRLAAHSWPGNVRELKNCIEFLAATATGAVIDAASVELYLQRSRRAPSDQVMAQAEPAPLRSFRPIKDEVRELERTRMTEALRAAHGNQTLAAALIEMPLRTFVAKMKQYGIDPKAARE